MSAKKSMPKSLRKFIRREKARIRREVLDIKEQEKLINKLYDDKRNTQSGNSNRD